jgi:glutamate carboxypeptidase
MDDFSELSDIINCNSYTKNKLGVDNVGRIYQNLFEQIGFSTTRFSRTAIGDHLLFSSTKTDAGSLLLLGHLDTVFPPNTFTHFSQDEHWIYGPGVCDMKGGNHVALSALRAVKQQKGKICDIDMLLVSDEEAGSEDSISLSTKLATNYQACLVFEAAGKNEEVVIGRKGVGTFIIDLQGKASHAGNHYQQGHDANLAAAHMIIALTKLTNIELGSTVNAGKVAGGIGANTISPSAQIIVEIRYSQTPERDRLLRALNEIISQPKVSGVSAILSGKIQRDVMQPNDKQIVLLKKLENILGESLPTEQRGGVSDANIIAATGVPTLDGFGPYGDGDHTINERAAKKSFNRRITQVSKILMAYSQAT